MSLFIIETEERMIEKYPSLIDNNAALIYMIAKDGTPVGEYSSLLKYRNPDIFEKVMKNVRADVLEGGSIVLYRQKKPFIITMVIQDSYKAKPEFSYLQTCFSKLNSALDKVETNNFYLSENPFNHEKQHEIKELFKSLNLFFI